MSVREMARAARQSKKAAAGIFLGLAVTVGAGLAKVGEEFDGAFDTIRQRTGALIIAVLRGNAVLSNPSPDTMLYSGDQVAVLGTTEQRKAFQALSEELSDAPPDITAVDVDAPHAAPTS